MEERVYDKDPYCRSCEGTCCGAVRRRNREKLYMKAAFDRVLFYPEGGRTAQRYRHGGRGPGAGSPSAGKARWSAPWTVRWSRAARRFRCWTGTWRFSPICSTTRESTCFPGLVHRRFGYDNVGFHMGREEVTVDFNGLLTLEEAEQLEREANQKIWENVPVRVWYPLPEELETLEYRSQKELDQLEGPTVERCVPGADCCACCGTHVERTGEIGMIKVTGLMHYKGGVRLSLLCGGRALQDYNRGQRQLSRISVLLSAKPGGSGGGGGAAEAEPGRGRRTLSAAVSQIPPAEGGYAAGKQCGSAGVGRGADAGAAAAVLHHADGAAQRRPGAGVFR